MNEELDIIYIRDSKTGTEACVNYITMDLEHYNPEFNIIHLN